MQIQRHALGRIARVGDLYDASTDVFCSGQSMLSRKAPKGLIEVTPINSVKCEVKHAKLRSDRCKNLGLQNELTVSVLAMDIPVQGSAAYLAASEYNEGETSLTFFSRFRKSIEKLNLDREDVKRHISTEKLAKSGATHVVTEVENGLTAVFSLSFYAEYTQEEEHLIVDFTRAVLETLDGKVCKLGKSTQYASVFSSCPKFRLEFFTDGESVKYVRPTVEGYATFLKNIAIFMNENKNVATPIAYTLIPVHAFANSSTGAQPSLITQLYKSLDDNTAKSLIDFMEEMEALKHKSRKFFIMFDKQCSLFDRQTAENMSNRMADIEHKLIGLKREIAKQVQLYRLGDTSIAAIEEVLRNKNLLRSEVDRFFAEFTYVRQKLDYLAKLSSQNVHVLDNAEDLPAILRGGEFFVFFAKILMTDEKFLENSAVFERLCNECKEKCVLVDTDAHHFHEHLECTIAHYKNGNCIDKDVCKLISLRQDYNIIKFKSVPKSQETKPHPRVQLEVACPKAFHSPGCDKQKRRWLCYDCQKHIEYAFNKRLYCGCGESETNSALWCCQDPAHGMEYQEYKSNDLEKQLEEIKKWKEFNVLLIGETGAGKSTWINSIANYVIHGSLDAAVDAPSLTCLIPCSFSVQKKAADVREIQVGRSENEVFETGKSATQKPKTYAFMYKNELIRFIDVPGVCDTRGPDQDRKNFDLILQELRTITELHAICILLVPDAPKLTLAFQYCINELLTYLHKSASRNIVFCFTKTRQTFYKAGQTLPILKKYLDTFEKTRDVRIPLTENTMYYFDNEGFRLLCAMKDGVEFEEKEKDAYRESWNISASETIRFLDYVIQLEPHRTREMLCLNEARRIIVNLTVPLAEISENIDTNLRLLEHAKKEIEQLDSAVVDLQPHLHRKQIVLDIKEIPYPRTVCGNKKCIETGQLPQSGVTTVHFKQTCHDHCYLTNIEAEKFPCPGLKSCWAMTNDKCRICQCGWDSHLHVRYLQELKEVTVLDKDAEKRLAEAQSNKAKKDIVLKGYNDQITKLTERHKRITEICASFGAFLHQNCIVPYNDAMIEYLEYAIKMARQEAVVSKSTDRINYLENYLKQYKEELDILKSKIEEGTEALSLDDVSRLKDELFSMNTPECNIAEYLKGTQQANEKHQKQRTDHFFETENNTPGGLQKKRRQGANQQRRNVYGTPEFQQYGNNFDPMQLRYYLEALNADQSRNRLVFGGNPYSQPIAYGQLPTQFPGVAFDTERMQLPARHSPQQSANLYQLPSGDYVSSGYLQDKVKPSQETVRLPGGTYQYSPHGNRAVPVAPASYAGRNQELNQETSRSSTNRSSNSSQQVRFLDSTRAIREPGRRDRMPDFARLPTGMYAYSPHGYANDGAKSSPYQADTIHTQQDLNRLPDGRGRGADGNSYTAARQQSYQADRLQWAQRYPSSHSLFVAGDNDILIPYQDDRHNLPYATTSQVPSSMMRSPQPSSASYSQSYTAYQSDPRQQEQDKNGKSLIWPLSLLQ